MIGALKKAYANFRGYDTTRSAVPPMEGPLRPNTALDEAPVAITIEDVDNLVATPDGFACSSGADLIMLEQKTSAKPKKTEAKTSSLVIADTQTLAAPISALAADGIGAFAIGSENGGVTIKGGAHDGLELRTLAGTPLNCPTALLFLDPDTLIVANGSSKIDPSQWKLDLMGKGHSGSVWRINLAARSENANALQIAEDLAYPNGLALRADGSIYVTEAWRHRVIAIDVEGNGQSVVLEDLPAYPSRLAPAADGGFWLAMFAPRNPLVEFVLLETHFREEMMDNINSDYWIAPSMAPSTSFLQPIQGGARKMLNRLKPWSPTFSYGLLCYCDADMQPRFGLHSRADGTVHGINSLCEAKGTLFAAAKGSGVIVTATGSTDVGGRK